MHRNGTRQVCRAVIFSRMTAGPTEQAVTKEVGGGRRPDLDGVRGLAILLVLLGHAFAGPVAASGVTLFFGLSGYLITGILRKERQRTGRIDFRRFYARRFTRLAPPLFLAVAVMALVHRGLAADSIWAPLTWTANYARLFHVPVYLFGHTWSLAVEEQFYIVWPLAFLAIMARRRPVFVLSIALALLMAWRLFLLVAGQYDYAYLALETAGTTILAGCLVVLADWKVRSQLAVLVSIGVLLLAPVVSWRIGGEAWIWVPFVTTPFVAVILAGAESCHWLTWRWLGFLGVTSYSLYLWHEPTAFTFVGTDRFTPLGALIGTMVGFAAYFLLERPLMRWREGRRAVRPAG